MRTSLARIGRVFLALTAAAVAVALLQIWGVLGLEPVTVGRLAASYGLLALLLGLHAVVSAVREDVPRNHDGDRLIE